MKSCKQTTIKDYVSFEGVGVHTGETVHVKVCPADENTGIIFVKDHVEIEASIKNVVCTTSSTTIGKDGEIISTIEHLMSAFHGLGIDNAIVIVKGNEIPILDGSSRIFVEKMLKVGLKTLDEKKWIAKLIKHVEFNVDDRIMIGRPSNDLTIEYAIDYQMIGLKETLTYTHSLENFKDIMNAKTFVIKQRWMELTSMNLGKGIIPNENTIILDDEVLKDHKVRKNCVKHKVLDCIGDLYLIGCTFHAHVNCYKGGHEIHIGFLRKVLNENALKFIRIDEVEDYDD